MRLLVVFAVHRGYEALVPSLGLPMCRDLDMVRMALASGLSVFPNACMRRGGARCHNFENCSKQANLRDIERADIVLVAYDSLFTGLSIDTERFAVVVIDEGCWERATRELRIGITEITAIDAVEDPRMDDPDEEARGWTELFRLRNVAAQALKTNMLDVVSKQSIVAADLTVADCALGAALERQLRVDPGLRPGLPQGVRRQAMERSRDANRSVRREALFQAMEQLLHGDEDHDGRIRLLPAEPGANAGSILVTGLHKVVDDLSHLPVLHLDATLRPVLSTIVLPGLAVTNMSAQAPHMTVTAVCGSFGKSTLVEDPKASAAENRRRRNRLRECVDYVRWQRAWWITGSAEDARHRLETVLRALADWKPD